MILHYHDWTDGTLGTGAVPSIMREMVRLFDSMEKNGLHAVDEIATGVQTYLAETNSAAADSRHVRALASRALIGSGRKNMASRLLLLGGGLVKISQSALVGKGTVLTLDLKNLVVKRDECLDLMFRRCLLLLVDAMAHMWDEAGGSGMLGLRNVRKAAESVLGTGARPGQVSLLVRDTKVLCERRLDMLRKSRHWGECPVVFYPDWMATRGKRQYRGNA